MKPYSQAERVARESYGKLLAYLSSRMGDVMRAEDALSDAFLRALETWPERGVPEQPEAWLLTTARRRIIDEARSIKTRQDHAKQLEEDLLDAQHEVDMFPDERLKLLFVCSHPAIDPMIRTPLMLQLVIGLDAATIASAFLVSPATMSQRLVRAKAKIRDTGIQMDIPAPQHLAGRLPDVLDAIYAAYGTGWETVTIISDSETRLTREAMWLAYMLNELLPDEPEVKGLLALLLYCESREAARRNAKKEYIPLQQQNTALWNRDTMRDAEELLQVSARKRKPGRYQLEAAIQSAHTLGILHSNSDWETIALLYEGVLRIAPSVGAFVSQAAAIAQARGWEAGLTHLDALSPKSIKEYQPYYALRAHLLTQGGRVEEANTQYKLAIELTRDPAIRAFLQNQMVR